MIKSTYIVIGGIILSLVFFLLTAWISLKFTTFGKIMSESAALGRMMEYGDIVAKYGDPFEARENALRIFQWGTFPLVSVVVGIYAGLLSKSKEVIVSTIICFPFIILTVSLVPFRFTSFIFSIFYLSLCCCTTYVTSKLMKKYDFNARPFQVKEAISHLMKHLLPAAWFC